MKSTELSAALAIRARQLFPDLVKKHQPWAFARRKDRYAAYRKVWQDAVWDAAIELDLWTPTPMPFVAELLRGIPTDMLEGQVGRDSHP